MTMTRTMDGRTDEQNNEQTRHLRNERGRGGTIPVVLYGGSFDIARVTWTGRWISTGQQQQLLTNTNELRGLQGSIKCQLLAITTTTGERRVWYGWSIVAAMLTTFGNQNISRRLLLNTVAFVSNCSLATLSGVQDVQTFRRSLLKLLAV